MGPERLIAWGRSVLPAVLLLAAVGCGGRFSPGGVDGPGLPPTVPPPPPQEAEDDAVFDGLGSLSPLVGGFDLRWDPVLDDQGAVAPLVYAVHAAFDGTRPSFEDAPLLRTAPGATGARLEGLAEGTEVQVGVRIDRAEEAADLDFNEVVLRGEVQPLLYVDASVASSGDGRSPAGAFRTIVEAIVEAISSGSSNVLVAEGTYQEQLATLGGVHLYGAHPAGFVGERSRETHTTTVRAPPGSEVAFRILASDRPTILDAIEFVAARDVQNGIEIREAELAFSNGSIRSMSAEGMTLTCKDSTRRFDLHRVQILDSGTEGLEARGSLDASLSLCVFAGNLNEGAEFDDLSPQPLETATLWVWRSQFLGNGDDGLDVDFDELDPLVGNTSEDGTCLVVIEGCVAADNGLWGLLLDIDFDLADEITLRCLLRANRVQRQGRDGIRLDGDQEALFALIDNRVSSNRGEGLAIASGGGRAVFVVANHWDLGAGQHGLDVLGPADVLGSHVAVTGSFLESVRGNGAVLLHNGALWDSAAPIGAQIEYSYSDFSLPGRGNFTGPVEVRRSPDRLLQLDQAGGVDQLTLPGGESAAVGEFLELDDDGVAREVVAAAGATLSFDPPAQQAVSPGTTVGIFPGADVTEDPRLVETSSWIDAGDPLVTDGDDSVTDVGILGGRIAAFRPARAGPALPLLPDRLEPGLGVVTGPRTRFTLRFLRDLDPVSADAAVSVLRDGVPLPGTLLTQGRTLHFDASDPVRSGTVEIAVSGMLRSLSGEALRLPFRTRVEVR